ncbi:MAG TPA: Uma2 family endonuclease [Verrucomicrobiota bacterium]|nr:Uma2 family endonuclease [Verrucomicrobiota bacterium]
MATLEATLERPVHRAAALLRHPLENGDVLTAPEFLRRYEAMPEVKKAELIEGVVYMGSPVRLRRHAKPDNLMQGILCNFAAETPGCEAISNATTILDLENVPQPDAALRLLEDRGGQSLLNAEDYLEGAPELVVEIAGSTAAKDLHAKKRAYRRAGVREYLVWVTGEPALLVFRRGKGDFAAAPADADGVWRSREFPGLWIEVPALLEQRSGTVLKTLQCGLAAREHAAFVRALRRRRAAA